MAMGQTGPPCVPPEFNPGAAGEGAEGCGCPAGGVVPAGGGGAGGGGAADSSGAVLPLPPGVVLAGGEGGDGGWGGGSDPGSLPLLLLLGVGGEGWTCLSQTRTAYSASSASISRLKISGPSIRSLLATGPSILSCGGADTEPTTPISPPSSPLALTVTRPTPEPVALAWIMTRHLGPTITNCGVLWSWVPVNVFTCHSSAEQLDPPLLVLAPVVGLLSC